MALVPLIMWGGAAALVNFYRMSAEQSIMPEMADLVPKLPALIKLVVLNILYSLELAGGLLLIKLGLK